MGKNVVVRFDEDLVKLMRRVASAGGEDVSSFVRRAVKRELIALGFLSDLEKKVLQIPKEELDPVRLKAG